MTQKERRKERMNYRTEQIKVLEEENYEIEHKNDDVYLINSFLRVHLLHNTFWNMKNGEQGTYKNLKRFVRSYVTSWQMKMYEKNYVSFGTFCPQLPRFFFLKWRPKLKKFVREFHILKSLLPKADKIDYEI